MFVGGRTRSKGRAGGYPLTPRALCPDTPQY